MLFENKTSSRLRLKLSYVSKDSKEYVQSNLWTKTTHGKQNNVVSVERWSLFRGQFLLELAIWGFGNMAFVERWSLFEGGLSGRFDCIWDSWSAEYVKYELIKQQHTRNWLTIPFLRCSSTAPRVAISKLFTYPIYTGHLMTSPNSNLWSCKNYLITATPSNLFT